MRDTSTSPGPAWALTRAAESAEEYAPRLFEILGLMEAKHPVEPLHYLFLLKTRPRWQGRGLGSSLMAPVLETCDRDGVPAYLVATSERNKQLYLRHGFDVTDEIALPDGPTMWHVALAPMIYETDVVAVGARLAGLAAARTLTDAGLSVTVLKERDHVGGRLLDHQLAGGGIVEIPARAGCSARGDDSERIEPRGSRHRPMAQTEACSARVVSFT